MAYRTVVNQFNSMDEMFTFTRERSGYHRGTDGRNSDAVMEYCRRGATEQEQAPVRKILAAVDSGVTRNKREIIATVAGGSVNVPDFLQGKPRCMRRRTMIESEMAPVTLAMEISVSGGMDRAAFAKRGAALAALAMRLSETRPVELKLVWADRVISGYSGLNTVGSVRLSTSPLSAAQITALCCDMGFQYAVTFATDNAQAGIGKSDASYGWAFGDPYEAKRNKQVREVLGMRETDIFIPGGHMDEKHEMIADPVAWVNKYLDPQREI